MSIVAAICWVLAAAVGSVMVAIWRRHGGMSNDTNVTHLRPGWVFSHLGMAVAGLIAWVIFLVTTDLAWAWVAFVAAVLAAAVGASLARRWAVDGRLVMKGRDAALAGLAEQHIPRLPVLLHGAFAGVTLVLVLLVALAS